MKNSLIAILLLASLLLGTLCFHRQTEMADLHAQFTAAHSQLAEKAEAADKAARGEQKLKSMEDALMNAQDALANSSKMAVEKTKLVGELAQSLAAAKTNDGNPLAAMMKDPKMRQLMVSQQKAMFGPLLARQYADFFKWLNLTPDQSAVLVDLMQKKRLAGADAKMSLFNGNADDTQRANVAQQVKSEKDAYDAQIKQFLGDENYQSFQEYEKSVPSRTTINLFSERLAGSATPLNSDQQQQLIQLMIEEHNRFPWATDVNQLVNNPGSAIGGLSSRLTDERINQSAQELEQFDQQFLERARQILAPEQAIAFEQFQSTQREMLSNTLKLGVKMLVPSGQ
jgi:hypothetical protein